MSEVKKVNISGIAIREGISKNNRKYTAKELEKFAPTLIGKPILKDHEGLTDNVIGKITKSESLDNGKIVTYEGWVKEDGSGIIEKLKDGRISEVSIGAFSKRVVKENKDDTVLIPIGLEAMELSTTPVPGVTGTSAKVSDFEKIDGLDFSEEGIKQMIESYEADQSKNEDKKSQSKDTLNKNKKEEKMESKTQKSDESQEAEKQTAVIASMQEKLTALEAEKTELESARKSDAIARYEEKAKAKGLKIQDLSNASMESIQLVIEMADDVPEPKEDSDDTSKEDSNDDSKEDDKPVAKTQSQDVDSSDDKKDAEDFSGYVLDSQESSGVAFYKYY